MLQMRVQGMTYRQIAIACGLRSEMQAFEVVIAEIQKMTAEAAAEARKLECDRLDSLLNAIWPKAMDGDTKAVTTVLGIMQRRAELLGLDAPARVDITHRVREMAIEMGIDPDIAVEEAEAIIRARNQYREGGR